jgi:hypothetical protein
MIVIQNGASSNEDHVIIEIKCDKTADPNENCKIIKKIVNFELKLTFEMEDIYNIGHPRAKFIEERSSYTNTDKENEFVGKEFEMKYIISYDKDQFDSFYPGFVDSEYIKQYKDKFYPNFRNYSIPQSRGGRKRNKRRKSKKTKRSKK